jgi:hypothetical protein
MVRKAGERGEAAALALAIGYRPGEQFGELIF